MLQTGGVTVVSEHAAGPGGTGDVERRLEMLAAVARRTGNAVIVTNREGLVEWVNEGYTRLTGYLPHEVTGIPPGALVQGPDTSLETRATMASAIARGQPFDVVVLNYARDGRQYWVRIEAEPTLDQHGALSGYIAIETDVTEQRIAEARELVINRIGELLLACGSVEDAARIVVTELVRTLDVRAAQLWVVEPGSPSLCYVAGASADADGEEWLAASRSNTFARGTEWVVGVGAPGVAWGTGTPCVKRDFWVADTQGHYSRRTEAGRRARIRTVFAVPVHGPEGVVAVLEVGGSHNYPGHDRLISLAERVAQQLGAFIVQHESRRAFEAIFRHSPDPMMVLDAAGQVVSCNGRATEVFSDVRGRRLDAVFLAGAALIDAARSRLSQTEEPHRQVTEAVRASGSRFAAEVTVSATTAAGAPSFIISVRDLTERLRTEDALRRSLEEKVTLVQEVHHRVKNNLQILSSLVSIQAHDVEGDAVRVALLDTANRIQSMALVHQQLYAHEDLSRIFFGEYARSLCNALRASLAPDATMEFELEEVEIAIERAVPVGLILNELVTNAFKYGRSPDGRCSVAIRLLRTAEGFAFVVSDDGPGVELAQPRAGSLGQTLIAALLRQLRARSSVASGQGTSGQGTSGQGTSGQGTSGQGTSGQGTTVRVDVPNAPG